MLSRTAENLYWLARYVERAEYLARTIEATLRVTALPNAYVGKTNEWDSALLTAGAADGFYSHYTEADERNVVEYLLFSTDNPSSIRNCIESARLNARAVRVALTGEMWDTINSAWIELQETWRAGPMTREQLAKFLRFVQEISLRFDGSAYRTMPGRAVPDWRRASSRNAGAAFGVGRRSRMATKIPGTVIQPP